ncbi:MAG: LysM peptidoglycan-binding domain-containing M23 family metallopeptidase [Cyanobium sp.]
MSIEELSLKLGVDETRLARLNGVNEDHRFIKGEWLALPSQQVSSSRLSIAIDLRSERTDPPVHPLIARVGMGDTLAAIATRHGLTEQELLSLNPELRNRPLVSGDRVRLSLEAPQIPARDLQALNAPGATGLDAFPDPQGESPSPFPGPGATSYVWPAKGVLTSGFGWRWGRMHKGIDIANSVGTPIQAIQDGRVTFAGWDDGGYGYLVELTHPDGHISLYAHNSRLLVKEGEEVKQGQQISEMGSTGRSTGPHLHFEIRTPGRTALNPLNVLQPQA